MHVSHRRPPACCAGWRSASGMHPEDTDPSPELNLVGRRALIAPTTAGWISASPPACSPAR